MGIKAGLVGLPNVGKSTLFNALTKSSVPAENYPFCTIDPHVAITEVPDKRIDNLVEIYRPAKLIPANVTFVDIAGLVKGAATGEGLGNQFLSHIREVDLIIHVLRCFESPDIIRGQGEIDPLLDYGVVNAELMLKDLESVEKRFQKVEKQLKSERNPAALKMLKDEYVLLQKIKDALNNADDAAVKALINAASVQTIPLLSAKKILIVANIAESELENNAYEQNPHYQSLVKFFGPEIVIPICVKTEYELATLTPTVAEEFMTLLGIKQRSIDTIIQKSYEHLGLITFFTCGPKEVHAWPITNGTTIRAAAGEIHSDLERGFICADIFNYSDLLEFGNEVKVKEHGRMRTEGQDYTVHDGDIVHIKFNV